MEELLNQLAQRVQGRYYGKFRGFVADNADPEHRGRLRVTVPSVLGEEITGWALPCLPFGGLAGEGFFAVPECGAQIWVEFEEGELSAPIWTGTFWQQDGDAPAEIDGEAPTKRCLKTPSGHILEFEDRDGAESVRLEHRSGARLGIDPNGTTTVADSAGATVILNADAGEITISDANGNTLTMSAAGTAIDDANGNRIEMGAAGIVVQGTKVAVKGDVVTLGGEAGEPLIKGQSFLTLFMTHIHPTAVGPSGPPIPQGELSTLSTKVTTT